MTDTAELRDGFAENYTADYAGWQNYWSEAQADMEFSLLAQYSEDEWKKAELQGRELYVIDKTKRQLDLLEGYEQRNRHILKITPTEGEDDFVSQQLTGIIMQIMAGGRGYTGYDCMSAAFKWGSLATGSNLLEIWKDRHGNLKLSRRAFNSFLLDPMMTQPDLSDCGHILTGQWVRSDRVKLLLPEKSDKIDNINPVRNSIRWPLMGMPLFQAESDVRLYEEWWRKETNYIETVLHRPSGREIPFKVIKKEFGDAKMAADWVNDQKMNGMPILSKYSKPVDKMLLTVFVDGEPVFDGENPLGIDDYNFIWMHGEWVPECGRDDLKLQSFIRCLRDPQRVFSHNINRAIDIVDSQIQTGKIMRTQYLENPEDAYRSGQGVHLHTKDDLPSNLSLNEVIQNIQSVDIKPGLFQLMEQVDKGITEAGGLNEEIFGTDDKNDRVPALLNKYRTGAALTGKQGIFSGFRASKRELGVKLVRIVQRLYDPFKVKRLLNQWPTKGFYVEDFNRYDCTPTEGMLTDTQRELSYLELKNIRAEFPDSAQYIPISMLLKMNPTLPKKEILEAIKNAEKQQQQQMQKQMQNQERANALVEAQTRADIARSKEDISDIQENRANIALKRAQTATEIRKLQGETSRGSRDEMFNRIMDVTDRLLTLEKIKAQKEKSRKKAKKGA